MVAYVRDAPIIKIPIPAPRIDSAREVNTPKFTKKYGESVATKVYNLARVTPI